MENSHKDKRKNPNEIIDSFIRKYLKDFIKEFNLKKQYDKLTEEDIERIDQKIEFIKKEIFLNLMVLIGIADTIIQKRNKTNVEKI